jgi:hypothetical protein
VVSNEYAETVKGWGLQTILTPGTTVSNTISVEVTTLTDRAVETEPQGTLFLRNLLQREKV